MFEPLPGPMNGERIVPMQFEQAKAACYQLAGWSPETVWPTTAKLMELDLEWVAEGTA